MAENEVTTSLKTSMGERDLQREIHVDIGCPHNILISQTSSTTTKRPYAQLLLVMILEPIEGVQHSEHFCCF